jgi:predicted RND superfamily exporter protein
MNRLANFIIDKRYWLMAVMLIITAICGVLALQTGINTDMTKYLPDDSNMKQGLDVMAANFPETTENSSIRVMFDDLTEAQKKTVLSELKQIKYVKKVDYEPNNVAYNKANHTLFVVSTTYNYNSTEELYIEEALDHNFPEYTMVFQNNSTQETAVPNWLLILAVSILLVILFVMSRSWLEPILFMLVIGIAVIINIGTNIFLGDTATLTISIGPILQLVLSMDYSIILINRYRQELNLADNKTTAMKSALTKSFSTICSSALTTVVGLLVLCFLSFKMGMELGIVLAKGVFISMICVFTLLPMLILLCDEGIKKTAKKVPQIKTNALTTFSFKLRHIIPIIFVLLFAGTFILQNRTKIIFTEGLDDPMIDIFPQENTTILVYNNADTTHIDSLIARLNGDKHIKSIIGYSNTLGKPYQVKEMTDVIHHISSDVLLDSSLLQMLYYKYYNGELPTIEAGTFLDFVADDVVENPLFAKYLDTAMTNNIDQLKKFSNKKLLTKRLNNNTLANFMGMDKAETKQLYLYYYILHGGINTGTMTLPIFANFIVNDVAHHSTYSSMFDEETLAQIKTMQTYTDTDKMTRLQDYKGIASTLGMDAENVKMLFVYYQAQQANYIPSGMTVANFVSFVQQDVASNPDFSSYIKADELSQLDRLAALTDKNALQTQKSASELATDLGMEERQVKQVFTLKYGPFFTSKKTMSVEQMVNFMLSSDKVKSNMTPKEEEELQTVQKIISNILEDKILTHKQMAELIGMDTETTKILFTYKASKNGELASLKLSVQKVVDFSINNSDTFSSMASANDLASLKTAKVIIDNSISHTAYSATELAHLIGMQPSQARQLYTLYISEKGDTKDWKLSPEHFVDFVIKDVLPNKAFSNQFDTASAKQLKSVQTLMHAVVSKKEYNAKEISDILDNLTDKIKQNEINLLYLYYAGQTSFDNSWTMSIEQMFTYLTNNIINDTLFSSTFDNAARTALHDQESLLKDGITQMKGANYSRLIILTDYPEESDETSKFLDKIDTLRTQYLTHDSYTIGASSLAHEIEKSFDGEYIKITLITAIAIFLVVLIAFRSFLVPLVLVLLVQCAVYITVMVIGLQGDSIYYLALLIVQSILMGATIDYAIVFSTYYCDNRKTITIQDSLRVAYEKSIYTIMTSGLILIVVTAILGVFTTQIISDVCTTIAIGSLSAVILILFILPGTLAAIDRLIIRKRKENQPNTENIPETDSGKKD